MPPSDPNYHGGIDPFSEPNGYIQWDEADLGGLFRTTSTPTTSKDSLEELYDLVDKRFNRARLSHRYVCVLRLVNLLIFLQLGSVSR